MHTQHQQQTTRIKTPQSNRQIPKTKNHPEKRSAVLQSRSWQLYHHWVYCHSLHSFKFDPAVVHMSHDISGTKPLSIPHSCRQLLGLHSLSPGNNSERSGSSGSLSLQIMSASFTDQQQYRTFGMWQVGSLSRMKQYHRSALPSTSTRVVAWLFPSGNVVTLQTYNPISAKLAPEMVMVASRTEGLTNATRLSYSWEMEVPNSGLKTAKVTVPEGRRRSQEVCVRLRLEPTSMMQLRVMIFPSTAFTRSWTVTWLQRTAVERTREKQNLVS